MNRPKISVDLRQFASFGVSLALLISVDPASAISIDLTSGTSGTLVAGQTFNETRGVDVTVLTGQGLNVSSLSLDSLSIGSSALVGARIYDGASNALIASADTTINSSGSVTIPISATLTSGDNFRIAFYVEPTPSNSGSGTFFDPDPPSIGGFPYIDSSGHLRINSAHQNSTDAFPSNDNSFVPRITVEATVVPEPGSVALVGIGALGLVGCAWRRRKQLRTKGTQSINDLGLAPRG